MDRRSLRIGITCYPTYGGSGVVATELGMALARRGHSIHFITYDRPFRLDGLAENPYFHEVEVSNYPLFKYPPYLISLANKLAEVAEYEQLDLLHVHYAIPHATAAYLAREMLSERPVKVVTTLHGTDITLLGSDPSFRRVIEFSLNQSDGITAVSRHLAAATERTFALKRPVRTIYNFVDPQIYRRWSSEEYCQRNSQRQGVPVIVHISNFRPVKQIETVIRVFALVVQQVPAQLWLIGDGPDSAIAHEVVRELGLEQRVCFLGKQGSVVPYLSQADLFLLPSRQESFGLAALEAMACEVPVVAARVGGLPEVVTDGESGYLLEPGDVAGMALRAVQLLTDRTLNRRMALSARERAVRDFGADQQVAQYEDFYAEVLQT